MSQLTSIEECKVGMIVFHPVWGKGVIKAMSANRSGGNRLHVKFDEYRQDMVFTDSDNGDRLRKTSHLFTEPVYICEKTKQWDDDFHDFVDEYLPIKPETK